MSAKNFINYNTIVLSILLYATIAYSQTDSPREASSQSSVLASNTTSQNLSEVCLRFTAQGRRQVQKGGCSSNFESGWIWVGDDSGYRNQNLYITAKGGAEVCIRFSAVRNRQQNRDWVCSSDGFESRGVWIGDDSGYKQQKIQIVTSGPDKVCLRHTKKGRRGTVESDWACSSDGFESPWLDLGDDSGYRKQSLKILLKKANNR